MASGGGDENGVKARIVLQQCLSARLMVQPATDTTPPDYVEIGRGLVVYLCFLKGATHQILDKMVKAVLNTRLSESDSGKLVSILELPGDIIVIPQATLGGRLKGRLMQYHGNVDKTLGLELYQGVTQTLQAAVEDNNRTRESACTVKWGTYGNRQVFNMDTNGPYSHLVEFS